MLDRSPIRAFLVVILAMAMLCCTNDSAASRALERRETGIALQLESKYEIPTSAGGLSNEFCLTEEHRLWSRGSLDRKSGLMYSDDLGKSWRYINIPVKDFGADSSIYFIDRVNGWARDDVSLLKTSDAGKSWERIALSGSSKFFTLQSLEFSDPDNGCVAGSTTHRTEPGLGTIAYGTEIICTNNSGRTWNLRYKGTEDNAVLRMIESKNIIVAVADQTVLLSSSDGGNNWTRKQLGFSVTDIDATGDGVLWAAAEEGGLYSSSNLGDTWQESILRDPQTTKFRFNSISIDDSGLGAAVGPSGTMFFTTDAGKSWQKYRDNALTDDLWTVRTKTPFIAVSNERKLYVFRVKP